MSLDKRKGPEDSQEGFSKRSKNAAEDDEWEDGFEEAISALEQVEAGLTNDSPVIVNDRDSPSTVQIRSVKWSRPDPPKLDPDKDSLTFQQIDIDYYNGSPLHDMSGCQVCPAPIVRMYGVTMNGNSVCCHVHGFAPYFFVLAPPGFDESHCKPFKESLNEAVVNDLKFKHEQMNEPVLRIETISRKNLMGYRSKENNMFLKIIVALPKVIPHCLRSLQNKLLYPPLGQQTYQNFETNIDFEIRFMVDNNIVGCSWIELPPGEWRLRTKNSFNGLEITSRCQLEVDIAWDKFVAHPPEGEWSKGAPFRILSFDIECAIRKNRFPDPKYDSVIQIANIVKRQGEQEAFINNIFTLKTCAPIDGSEVLCYEYETELLKMWADFVQEVDPDIFTGYNINYFDFPYLINRGKLLGVVGLEYLGRIKNTKSIVKDVLLKSKQKGLRANKYVNTEGRVVFDLYIVVTNSDIELPKYSLNDVSNYFLQERKEDVDFNEITDLQNGNAETRRRLAVYCLKDAYLPLRLLEKLEWINNYVKMASVTGISVTSLLYKTEHFKNTSAILRKLKLKD